MKHPSTGHRIEKQMPSLKTFLKKIPLVRTIARQVYPFARRPEIAREPFPGSKHFWEERYRKGDTSGVGSYGKFAAFKAEVINSFVLENGINSIIEFGSGDGNQLALADYPQYIGFDVSNTAIAQCRNIFAKDATKSFYLMEDYSGQTADLTLSLDVIYHLIEDSIFETYMRRLFESATKFVIIYSSDTNENDISEASHVRHRKFTDWITNNAVCWSLKKQIPNRYPYKGDYTQGSFSHFFIFEKGV